MAFAKKVKVELRRPVDVDSISIVKDSYFPNAYVIDFPLDSKPGHVWQDIFYKEWTSSRHLWDRKVFVIGDNLRLVTTPYEIEEKIGWIKQVIDATNERVDEYNRELQSSALRTVEDKRCIEERESRDQFVKTIKESIKRKLQELEF